MEQKIDTKRSGNGWGLVLASAALALAAAVFPFALLAVPALWAYTMLRTRPAWLSLFGALLLLPEMALTGILPACALTLLAVGGALCLYTLQKRRMRCLYAAAAVAGLSIACLYGAICLPGILSGAGAFAAVQAVVDEVAALYRALMASAAATLPPESVALFEESLQSLIDSVPTLVVPALCAFGAALGLSNLLFFRLLARRRREALGLAPMRALRFWSLPQSCTFGVLLLLIGSLVLEWIGMDYAAGVTATVNVLVGAPLIVQGLALVDFWIVRKGGSVTGRRALVYTLLGVLFALSQSLLMMLGCVEQLFRFRERDGSPLLKTPPKL